MSDFSDNRIDRHIPLHPLPDDIRKMGRDETVCKFCGVSYLIHNEIKALEDKIAKLESQLKDYDRLKEKESQFKHILDEQNTKIDELERKLGLKAQMIQSLNNDIDVKQLDCNRLAKKLQEIENDLNLSHANNQRLKKNQISIDSIVNTTKLSISQQKSSLKALELLQQSQMKSMNETINELRNYTKKFNIDNFKDSSKKEEELEQMRLKQNQISKEIETYKNEISVLAKQNESLKSITMDLNAQLRVYEHEKGQTKQVSEMYIKSEEEKRNLMQENNDLKSKIETIEIKLRNSTLEYNDIVNKSKSIEKELSSLQSNVSNTNKKHATEVENLQKELSLKNDELNRIKTEQEKNVKMLREKEKQFENETTIETLINLDEIFELNAQVKSLQQKITEMESERSAMTLAHQCQITQLKDSFKERYKLNENWPEKLANELQREREKYENLMKQMEAELKQNFQIEKEIQEQKYKDMIAKYNTNMSDIDGKSKDKLMKYEQENQNLKEKYRNLYEEKQNYEQKTRTEIENLRNITKELHESLEKYTNSDVEEQLQRYKQDAYIKDNLIAELKNKLSLIEKQFDQSREEVKVLQETVHKECMERQELHDLLEETREDLLNYKKNTYASSQIIPIPTHSTRNMHTSMQSVPIVTKTQSSSSLIDVNNNPVKINNGISSPTGGVYTNRQSSADNYSIPPSSSHSLNANEIRRSQYNDTVHRTSAIINNNPNPNQPPSSIQLFSKINKIQQQQQSSQPSSSTTTTTNNNTKMPSIMNDNRRKLSLLLSRKS